MVVLARRMICQNATKPSLKRRDVPERHPAPRHGASVVFLCLELGQEREGSTLGHVRLGQPWTCREEIPDDGEARANLVGVEPVEGGLRPATPNQARDELGDRATLEPAEIPARKA